MAINMNALHNVGNPNQTNAKRVLCVCSAGLLRSPTTANVLHKEYGYNTRAAGINEEYALIPVTPLLLHWADEIVCMEPHQKEDLETLLSQNDLYTTQVYCLNVPDRFQWQDGKLTAFIKAAYENREL